MVTWLRYMSQTLHGEQMLLSWLSTSLSLLSSGLCFGLGLFVNWFVCHPYYSREVFLMTFSGTGGLGTRDEELDFGL